MRGNGVPHFFHVFIYGVMKVNTPIHIEFKVLLKIASFLGAFSHFFYSTTPGGITAKYYQKLKAGYEMLYLTMQSIYSNSEYTVLCT